MGRNVVGDQEMWTELARFAAGDRPEPPRPEA